MFSFILVLCTVSVVSYAYFNYCLGGFESEVFWKRKSRYAWLIIGYPIILLLGQGFYSLPKYRKGKKEMSVKEKSSIAISFIIYISAFILALKYVK